MISAAIRVSLVFFFIFVFIGHGAFYYFLIRDRWKRIKRLTRLISLYARLGKKLTGLKVKIQGEIDTSKGQLIVSNHLSYLDILAIVSEWPCAFVTSMEIKETPILGHLCQMAGCLFVERRSRENLSNEIRELTDALNHGVSVCIFPEATSTNGDTVIRFRRPLFMSAIDSQSDVQPIVLNYYRVGNEPLSLKNRDNVFWYDKMSFLPHLWSAAKSREIHVEVRVLEPISSQPDSETAELAQVSHDDILRQYTPPLNV
jgi:1-acyl-sn-glycerol-3-phosphate acyltransferase